MTQSRPRTFSRSDISNRGNPVRSKTFRNDLTFSDCDGRTLSGSLTYTRESRLKDISQISCKLQLESVKRLKSVTTFTIPGRSLFSIRHKIVPLLKHALNSPSVTLDGNFNEGARLVNH